MELSVVLEMIMDCYFESSLSAILLLIGEITGKNNKFPILDILGFLKNTHKNPKFGKVRQVPTREFPTKFPGWDLSHSLGFLWVFFKYPKISKNGYLLFFPVDRLDSATLSALPEKNCSGEKHKFIS